MCSSDLNAFAEDRQNALNAGMNDFVTKPFTADKLEEIFDKWLPSKPALTPQPASPPEAATTGIGSTPPEPAGVPAINSGAVAQGLRTLAEAVGNDMVGEVISLFATSVADSNRELQTRLTAEEWEPLGRTAHKLKGLSRQVGADDVGGLCEQLEKAGKTGAADSCRQLTPQVMQAVSALAGLLPELYRQGL